MKYILAMFALITAGPHVSAQTWAMFNNHPWPDAQTISNLGQVCHAPFDSRYTADSTAAKNMEAVIQALNEGRERFPATAAPIPIIVVPVAHQGINAWTFSNLGSEHMAVVCVFDGIFALTSDSPQETAAVIAHEMGHALDRECWNYSQRTRRGQSSCEARADAFGFMILVNSRMNPFAFAGAFGRLEMYQGDTETNIMARFENIIASNHPMTPDRIQHAHEMLASAFAALARKEQPKIAMPPALP